MEEEDRGELPNMGSSEKQLLKRGDAGATTSMLIVQ